MQTVGDACHYFNEHLIVGIKLTRPTTSTPGELGSNGKLLSSRMESSIMLHLDKAGRPEKFIPDSSSSSANEKVFGNVHGSRLTAPTTNGL